MRGRKGTHFLCQKMGSLPPPAPLSTLRKEQYRNTEIRYSVKRKIASSWGDFLVSVYISAAAETGHTADEVTHFGTGIYRACAVYYFALFFRGKLSEIFQSRCVFGKRISQTERYLRLFVMLHNIIPFGIIMRRKKLYIQK